MRREKCEFCPGTDLLRVWVDKAYRRGGTTYEREDGEYWIADEFNLDLDNPLPGILDGGSVDMVVCLDCQRIQGFALTAEQKAALIAEHIKHGHNPLERQREKDAEKAARKAEREAKEVLYAEWRKGQPPREL